MISMINSWYMDPSHHKTWACRLAGFANLSFWNKAVVFWVSLFFHQCSPQSFRYLSLKILLFSTLLSTFNALGIHTSFVNNIHVLTNSFCHCCSQLTNDSCFSLPSFCSLLPYLGVLCLWWNIITQATWVGSLFGLHFHILVCHWRKSRHELK